MLRKTSLSNSRTGLRFAPSPSGKAPRDVPVPLFATEGTTCPAQLCSCLPLRVQVIGRWEKAGELNSPRPSLDRPSPPRTAQHGPLKTNGGRSRIQIPRTEPAELEETRGRSQPAASPWTGHGKTGGPGSRRRRPLPSPKYNLSPRIGGRPY